MQVSYNGGFDSVDVPAFNLIEVQRGEPVDVTDAEAEALCASPDWSTVTPPAKGGKTAPDPSPAPPADAAPATTPDAGSTTEAAS